VRVDTSQSVYREAPNAEKEFDRLELRRARYLMRRLQFLEAKVRDGQPVSGGIVFAEMEIEALEWALGPDGLDYLVIER
jgi:hypothetical protein